MRELPPETRVPTSAPSRERVIRELDGIRGIAILLVLALHFGARPPGVPRFFTAPFALGWTGVDLFFVLSGFLITGILLDTKSAANYFASFYARRVLRIFPLYLCAVGGYFLVALPLAHRFGYWLSQTDALQVWFWCHVSNWQSAIGNDVGPFGHFWSLAVEEQFYLVWPLVVYLVPRSKFAGVCGLVIASSLTLRVLFSGYLSQYPEFLYRLTPFRLDALAFGGLAAAIVRSPTWSGRLSRLSRAIAVVAVLAFAAILAVARTHKPSHALIATVGFSLIAVTYACFVFGAYVRAGSPAWWARILRSRFLVAFGKYSYALYVLHYPISAYQQDVLMAVARRVPSEAHVLLWAASKILGIGISFLVAFVSWHVLEKHFLRLKKRFVPVYAADPARADEVNLRSA